MKTCFQPFPRVGVEKRSRLRLRLNRMGDDRDRDGGVSSCASAFCVFYFCVHLLLVCSLDCYHYHLS